MGGAGYGGADFRVSRQAISTALEKGIRHFDTAGFYAKGQSERLLSTELSGRRKEVFISTKGGLAWEGNRVFHRAAPEDLRQQLFESLERLDTDYVDLFQLHWPDPEVPLKESISALKDMKRTGLIRFWGAGNLGVQEIADHLPPGGLVPLQTPFSPCRPTSSAILRAGFQYERAINCIVSPFEQGLLADPRFLHSVPGKKDIRRKNPLFSCRELKKSLVKFFSWAQGRDIPATTIVLLWLLGIREVDIVIPGPRTPAQVMEILAHADLLKDIPVLKEGLHSILATRLGTEALEIMDELGKKSGRCLHNAGIVSFPK